MRGLFYDPRHDALGKGGLIFDGLIVVMLVLTVTLMWRWIFVLTPACEAFASSIGARDYRMVERQGCYAVMPDGTLRVPPSR